MRLGKPAKAYLASIVPSWSQRSDVSSADEERCLEEVVVAIARGHLLTVRKTVPCPVYSDPSVNTSMETFIRCVAIGRLLSECMSPLAIGIIQLVSG